MNILKRKTSVVAMFVLFVAMCAAFSVVLSGCNESSSPLPTDSKSWVLESITVTSGSEVKTYSVAAAEKIKEEYPVSEENSEEVNEANMAKWIVYRQERGRHLEKERGILRHEHDRVCVRAVGGDLRHLRQGGGTGRHPSPRALRRPRQHDLLFYRPRVTPSEPRKHFEFRRGRPPVREVFHHSCPACRTGIIRTGFRAILFGAFAQPKLAGMYTIDCVPHAQNHPKISCFEVRAVPRPLHPNAVRFVSAWHRTSKRFRGDVRAVKLNVRKM